MCLMCTKKFLKENKLKGKFNLLSLRMVTADFVMLRYKMTDTQLIKSMRARATVMHNCMQLKDKIIIFHAQSIDL